MKTYLSIILATIFTISFSQSFDLLDEDYLHNYGAYLKQEGRKITIYDTQNYSHFGLRSSSTTNHEYLVIRNSTDTTVVQSSYKEISSQDDSTYFVIINNQDTILEITSLIYPSSDLYNINYQTSSNDLIVVNTIEEWDAEYLTSDTTQIPTSFFADKYINLNIELTFLPDSFKTCEFGVQEIFVNGVSKHTFDQYETTNVSDLGLEINDTVYIEFTQYPRECTEFTGMRSDVMIVRDHITSSQEKFNENNITFHRSCNNLIFNSTLEEIRIIDLRGNLIQAKVNSNEISIRGYQGFHILQYKMNGVYSSSKINL